MRLRALARQRPELATLDLVLLDIQSLREIMTRGDGTWDIVTAKFFSVTSRRCLLVLLSKFYSM